MDLKNLYKELAKPLPKEAIERAKKEVTRKGYDTTGYQYQYVVDRLNEVLGIEGWTFQYALLREAEGKYKTGQPYFDITVSVSITIGTTTKTCVGGHISASYSDALKGAITNAFKKTAAFFGLGADAYRGTIDEDYRPPVQEKSLIDEATETVAYPPMLTQMLDWSIAMCDGNLKEAEDMILAASEFPNKDGKTIRARNFEHLRKSEKWLGSTHANIKKNWEAWNKNEELPF